MILLREEGYPCVFYGDYYGVPHNRLEPIAGLKTLLELRRDAAYGVQHDYFNHPKIIGWTREGLDELEGSGFAVIMTVEKGGTKRMYVGRHFAGCVFTDILNHVKETIKIDKNGYGYNCFRKITSAPHRPILRHKRIPQYYHGIFRFQICRIHFLYSEDFYPLQ